jgi:4-amino-4-deoxy-L-arabinose transferase-like glycosyltransferase
MPDPGPARSRTGLFLAAAGVIVGTALWLRFHRIGLYELWLDEAFSFEMATTANLREVLLRENNPPLYYLLQRFWFHLFGGSEAALRSLAAVSGTCFVAAVIPAGRRFLGPAAGLWAGAIAALAPLHVYYAQEARAYSLLVLVILLSYMALWRALHEENKISWAVFSGCTLFALATHYMAVLALVPAAVLVWIWPEPAGRRGRWERYLAASALAAAPWLCWVVWSFWVHPHPEGAHSWIQRIWLNTPPWQAIPKSLEVLVLGSQAQLIPGFFKQFTLLAFPPALRTLGVPRGFRSASCGCVRWSCFRCSRSGSSRSCVPTTSSGGTT